MSTQINQYIIYGIKLNYEDYKGDVWYDKFEPYMDSPFKGIKHHNGLCVLFDGMDGDYIVIGHVVYKTDDGGHFADAVPIGELSDREREFVRNNINLAFGIDAENSQYYVVGHYR